MDYISLTLWDLSDHVLEAALLLGELDLFSDNIMFSFICVNLLLNRRVCWLLAIFRTIELISFFEPVTRVIVIAIFVRDCRLSPCVELIDLRGRSTHAWSEVRRAAITVL